MRLSLATIVAVFALPLAVAPAFGHGMVGRRAFVEPFVTEGAIPTDQFVIARPQSIQSRQGREFSLGFALEKKLSPNLSLGVESAGVDQSPDNPESQSGLDNVHVRLKYAAKHDRRREFALSFGLEVEAPTGDRKVGASPDTGLRPLVMFAKGCGDFPEDLWRLQPLAVMGDAGFDTTVSKQNTGDAIFYDVLLMYSTPYLEAFVWDPRIPAGLEDIIPVVEFNYTTKINGPQRTTRGTVTPGLMYLGKNVQLGVGARLPLNDTTRREIDWGIVGVVDILYDNVFPAWMM